jgi:hypothetical protein
MKGMVMVVMDYRTQDGLAQYGFSIEFQPDEGWRVYVIFDPFRKGQCGLPQSPYEALDNDGRCYVGWRSKLDNLADARKVAEIWAELVQGDQRAQQERDLYIGLIKHCSSSQEKKGVNDEVANNPNGFGQTRTDAA